MRVEIKVPVMGESVSEAILSSFIASSGSYVESGQEILELETDKVNQVLYAPQSGVLVLTASLGSTVKIGETIGFIDTSVQPKESLQKNTVPEPTVPEPTVSEPTVSKPTVPEQKGYGARQSTDLFLSKIQEESSLPQQEKSARLPQIEEKNRKRMSGLRKTIAARLVEVKNKTAMLTTFNEVDMSAILDIRNREKENFQERYGVKLGFMSFFVKAAVAALKTYPVIHSMIEGEEVVSFSTFNIGVAVSTEKGLFVPVIRQCDLLSFGEIEKEIALQAKKAREGTISVEDLKGGSFTITNGGVFGSLLSTPILNPPQSAILGMHSIVKRPIALNDQVVIRPMMYLALSYDHRLIDGREAVLFLVHMKASLEDPSRMLLEL
jgi:2-oxoglutarate dehydrogenase E2 component (dihydrolipoamide succinyltransferase)